MHYFYLKCEGCGNTVEFQHPDNFFVRLTVIDCLTCEQRRTTGDTSIIKRTELNKKDRLVEREIKLEGNSKDDPLIQQLKKEGLLKLFK